MKLLIYQVTEVTEKVENYIVRTRAYKIIIAKEILSVK